MMVAWTRMVAAEMVGRIRIRIHFIGESGFSDKLDVNVKERGVRVDSKIFSPSHWAELFTKVCVS